MDPTESPWSWIGRQTLDPALNMAMDEALLEASARLARPVLRFYAWTSPAATFGYFQRYEDVAQWTALRPLIRRPTAGGLVPHDADWTYSVVVPPGNAWCELTAIQSYQRVHRWLQRGFTHLGIQTVLAPEPDPSGPGQCFIGAETHDLLAGRRKIAGAAQRRNKLGLLIQGSVQPLNGWKHLRTEWENALLQVGSSSEGPDAIEQWSPTQGVLERAQALVREKYESSNYLRRR